MTETLSSKFRDLKFMVTHPGEVLLLNTIMSLSIILLLIVVFFVNQKFAETNRNFDVVSSANAVITEISVIESNFFKVGNEVRASMLGHNPEIADSVPSYHRQMDAELAKLAELWASSGGRPEIMDTLGKLTEARFALWQQMIADEAYTDSSEVPYIIEGNKTFGHILRLTSGLKKTEYEHLNRSLHDSHHGIRVVSVLVVILTFLSIALIVFAFTRINREVVRGREIGTLLENKVKEIDRSNQQLEQFAYVASHDLHDPLRKLNVFGERLEQKESERLSPDGKELIRRMQKLITQMQQLIDGLLSLSLNYNQADKKTVDLNKVLEDVRQNLSLKISQSGALIQSQPLPVMQGFESQLEQLFQNLVSNSIRYAKKDVPPRIDIAYSRTSGHDIPGAKKPDRQKQFHRIAFLDNGIGFDNKYAEKIFVIFQRLHGRSEYEGSGIGLSTCKLVVENHDGYIIANGKINEGAEFVIYLPVL